MVVRCENFDCAFDFAMAYYNRPTSASDYEKRKRSRLLIGLGCFGGSLILLAVLGYAAFSLYEKLNTELFVETGSAELVPQIATLPPTAIPLDENGLVIPTAIPTPTIVQPTATPVLVNETAVFGGGTGRIAYASNEEGNFDIYTIKLDGTDRQRLTDSWFGDWRPIWSPDGSKIVFHSKRDGNWEIYLMDADGQNKLNLSENSADDSFPDWSPDGSRIVFHSNRLGGYEIFAMNIDGTHVDQLTATVEDEFGPAISPDGKKIIFTRNQYGGREIFIMNPDGSDVQQLTNDDGGSYFPRWSADGSRIVFHTDRDGNYEIYTMAADGSDQTRVTNTPLGEFFAAFSPDGQWIMFHNSVDGTETGNRNLLMIGVDGKNQRVIVDNPEQERMPNWQPLVVDGQ